MPDGPLLMIPGPVEISPAVHDAFACAPPSHLAPCLIEAFGASLEMMRKVWLADSDAQPFVVAGGGTVAMDMAAANLVEPGARVAVVNTGYFSDRMAEMLRRQGAEVVDVRTDLGDAPSPGDVGRELDRATGAGRDRLEALFVTHVDTSTGVRVDPEPLARLARERDMLSVFDGVCATAGETFRMADWGADLYLTGSQKALGLPPGLALFVASPRALEARDSRRAAAPAMYLDWQQWIPVMKAYEERRPSYFSTPATNLVLALEAALREILSDGVEAGFAAHARAASAMRAAWRALGLELVPAREAIAANTLSALRYPEGTDASLVRRVADRGVVVAGGLHPRIRDRYFRVGHMGHAVHRPGMLRRTVEAVAGGLEDAGRPVDTRAGVEALEAIAS